MGMLNLENIKKGACSVKKVYGLLIGFTLTAVLAGCADDPDPEEKKDENPPVEQESYNMELRDGNMVPGGMEHGRYPDEMNRQKERQKEKQIKKDRMD
ncbi:hypothetical protein CEF21_00055 [Bacillus sp. FJAT-42376]|uniref:hypothetical protein n=1 Tax=Bacillus sp. FJAT-42376 TaxID=2014076 RepID=UPI000F4F6D4E|nr:hypothetical protein [Bacillus sp. FJAT-42376]AZB40864.1 hypothetical protein CEF21_00055 [Bacillus sp. FJAT-42376]